MAEVIKLNSKRALVVVPEQELIANDLMRWVRTDSKGWGNRDFISIQPIEAYVSKVYHNQYPTERVFIAEKIYLNNKDVHAVVRVHSFDYHNKSYNHYHVKMNNSPVLNKSDLGELQLKYAFTSLCDITELMDNLDLLNESELQILDGILSDMWCENECENECENGCESKSDVELMESNSADSNANDYSESKSVQITVVKESQ